ncbi:outer membrane protein assembly factor BamA [Candidatus Deianiraea vastatrix]|uniref:Outer membrane protein assembly factor BamA n=1 Tax=Candidatus Deianiraea vastatrix TaxID=2163644 RepID=A0A5B8XF36_9RICK|nr:outer membrane protein assembly factor BamA [Candidatus Deianiraea vastatrix]QED23525.1 Outer membrane protein assembly factor BamA precursor [Candidatus Deianiraea vastatrix]
MSTFIVLIFCAISNAQIVQDAKLMRNGRIDKESVLLYSGIKIGEDLNPDNISDAIRNLYDTEAFSSIKVTFENGTVVFDLLENPIVNRVYFDGSEFVTYDKVKDELQIKERGIYSRAKIKNDAQKLEFVYASNGYLSAIVEPKVVLLEGNRVDIVFEFFEGNRSKIEKVNFHGNEKVKNDKLYEIIPIKSRNKWNIFSQGDDYQANMPSLLQSTLSNYYKENGFIDVFIEDINAQFARDYPAVAFNIYIKEGEKYTIRDVKIENNVSNLTMPNVIKFTQKLGQVYSLERASIDLEKVRNIAYKLGFGYTNVLPRIDKISDNIVDIVYVINDDEIQIIKSVNISGNEKSKDYIIRRELLFQEGSVLIDRDLQRSENRLRSLGYFKEVKIQKRNIKNSKEVIVDVILQEENRRGMLNLSGGYSNFEGKVLSFGMARYNVFGKGYDISTDFSSSAIMQSLSAGISTARFGDSKFGGGINFGISSFDARKYGINYLSKSYSITPHLSYRLGDNLFHSIYYSYSKSSMTNTVPANAAFQRSLLNDQYRNTETSSIINSIFYDTRDNFVLPNIGTRVGGSQTIAGLGGTQRFFKHDFEYTIYKPIISRSATSMFSIKMGNISGYGGEDVLFQNRYWVSYYNMRGVGYGGIGPRLVETMPNGKQYVDVISYRGNNYAVATLEQYFGIPFIKDTSFRMYGFADFGALYGFDGQGYRINSVGNTEEIYDSRKIRSAFGFGIAIPTPMFGLIKFDYAVKVNVDRYDNVQKFRISLGGMPLN